MSIKEIIWILDSSEREDKKEALLKIRRTLAFLKFLNSEKVDLRKYEQVLELNQDVIGSLSVHLENESQFLLSTKVKYDELQQFNQYGGNGYVDQNGIFIPKSLEADDHFLGGYLPKVPYIRHSYSYPFLDKTNCEYDAGISFGLSKEDNYPFLFSCPIDCCIGDILDTEAVDYPVKRKEILNRLEQIRSQLSVETKFRMEKDSSNNHEAILLSKSR